MFHPSSQESDRRLCRVWVGIAMAKVIETPCRLEPVGADEYDPAGCRPPERFGDLRSALTREPKLGGGDSQSGVVLPMRGRHRTRSLATGDVVGR